MGGGQGERRREGFRNTWITTYRANRPARAVIDPTSPTNAHSRVPNAATTLSDSFRNLAPVRESLIGIYPEGTDARMPRLRGTPVVEFGKPLSFEPY
jgi:hypothetical protein